MAFWDGAGGGIIAGGASLIGGLISNRESRHAAQAQMDFQERMSNTAYQRSMSDMKKAGLNPMLAYKMGGADTPSGASYQAQNAMEPAVNSALSAMKMRQDAQQSDATIALTQDQAKASQATAREANARATVLDLQRPREQIKNEMWQMLKKNVHSAKDAMKYIPQIVEDAKDSYPILRTPDSQKGK